MLFTGCSFKGNDNVKFLGITNENKRMKKQLYFLNYDLRANGEVYLNGLF